MKHRITALILAACLPLCGCASLLERSYSSVEPYTDRYFDPGAEDTLRAESYQDLVNSLLMLIEQRSEEAVIRYYADEDTDIYAQAAGARREVQNETLLGSYLLDNLTLAYSSGVGYSTLTYSMTYREDAQDISTLMTLSDTLSLVDLLRVALREGHDSVTAQFISELSREDVAGAVTDLWQELYLDELEASGYFDPPPDDGEADDEGIAASETGSTDENGTAQDEPTAPNEDTPPADTTEDNTNSGEEPEDGANEGTNELPPAEGEDDQTPSATDEDPRLLIEFPPCPWEIIFYPNADIAEIVTIHLK